MTFADCPLCGFSIHLETPTIMNDLFNCPACHQQLEIARREPLELMLTQTKLDDLDEFFDELSFGEYPGEAVLSI